MVKEHFLAFAIRKPKRDEVMISKLELLNEQLKESQIFVSYYKNIYSGKSIEKSFETTIKRTGWSRATFFRRKKKFDAFLFKP